MSDQITKAQLLDKIRIERAKLNDLISKIPSSKAEEPGVDGDWSLKDIVAHICWGEHKVIGMIHTHTLSDPDIWKKSKLDRDEAISKRIIDRPWVEVRAEANQLINDLSSAIKAMNETDLNDPSGYQGLPQDTTPLKFIADNTYMHYRTHLPDLQAWVENNP